MKKMMYQYLIGMFLYSFTSGAWAQQSGELSPDIGAAKKRAAVCFACHGEEGISAIPGTPHLAGQQRIYLESALRAYRDGQTRQNPTMNAMAKPLSDRDIVNIASYFSLQAKMSGGQTAAQALEAIARIKPVGTSVVAESVVVSGSNNVGRSGEVVYGAVCMACHDTGAANAPKTGDKAAWIPRINQGLPTLLQHATNGLNAMPAKGGCSNCSDQEIKGAVEYIISKAK